MLVVGLLLFVGEALFGSIGWGVLDGSELLLGVGVLLVLAIIDLDWGRAMIATCLIAIVVGLVVDRLAARRLAVARRPNTSRLRRRLPAPTRCRQAVPAGTLSALLLGFRAPARQVASSAGCHRRRPSWESSCDLAPRHPSRRCR
jgi:hypothetical protein